MHGIFRTQTASDLADGLAKAVGIFDQCEAEEALSGFAEAATGAHRDVGFLEKFHRKVD
jgi:hypothetical protein